MFELTGLDTTMPIVATAIHDGHQVRPDLLPWMAVTPLERLREEDPHTAALATVAEARIVVRTSRFEVDLNRAPEAAVYRRPEDAWGLRVWREGVAEHLIAHSLERHAAFYRAVRPALDALLGRFDRIAVLDLHSYNHRRAGPGRPPADPRGNPEINVGTGSLDRATWGRLVDGFMDDLRRFRPSERTLDVRENIRFVGGYFSRWVNTTYPGRACALAIELKKTFMDEWSNQLDGDMLAGLREALASTLTGLVASLNGA